MDFQREYYFSQTEACKLYKVSPKKFKKIISDNNILTVNNHVKMHSIEGKEYEITTIYVLKKDFIKVMMNT